MIVTLVPGSQAEDGHLRSNVIELANKLKCSTQTEFVILSCLQQAKSSEILEAASELDPYRFGPSNDHLFAADPFFYTDAENAFYRGMYNKVPLIAGFNSEDGILKASKFINNESLLLELNDNWDFFGTKEIFGKCCDFTEMEVKVANDIRYKFVKTFNKKFDCKLHL